MGVFLGLVLPVSFPALPSLFPNPGVAKQTSDGSEPVFLRGSKSKYLVLFLSVVAGLPYLALGTPGTLGPQGLGQTPESLRQVYT